jgi:3-oxoacyl-[acyl-carrier-protein] synthase-3
VASAGTPPPDDGPVLRDMDVDVAVIGGGSTGMSTALYLAQDHGIGAVVLEASENLGILATDIHADGKHVGLLCVPGHVQNGQILGDPVLKMDGQGVFKLAVGVLEATARAVLDKAGLTDADLDWLVPHQANIRIIQSTAKKLKLPMEKVILTVAEHGNTSAASIPLALDAGVRSGQMKPGQLVMLEGVGGGFAWGSVLLRY